LRYALSLSLSLSLCLSLSPRARSTENVPSEDVEKTVRGIVPETPPVRRLVDASSLGFLERVSPGAAVFAENFARNGRT